MARMGAPLALIHEDQDAHPRPSARTLHPDPPRKCWLEVLYAAGRAVPEAFKRRAAEAFLLRQVDGEGTPSARRSTAGTLRKPEVLGVGAGAGAGTGVPGGVRPVPRSPGGAGSSGDVRMAPASPGPGVRPGGACVAWCWRGRRPHGSWFPGRCWGA
jgi:hypothetical protein